MYSLHNHTEYSNASCGFSDSVNHLEKLIKRAKEYELKGIAITDHELLGGHYKAQQIGKKMDDLKVILGNEIYLQSPEEHYDIINKLNKEKPVYPHFILQALDKEGHKQLRELTTEAWKRAYTHGGIIRRPTLTSDIEKIIGGNQGHVVAQTACLGSTFARLLLELINAQDKDMQNIKMKIHTFVQWNLQVFGNENFFIEIHPVNAHEENVNQEQLSYNLKAIEIANAYGIPYIVATDSHFLSKEDFKVQSAFLNSKDGDREVDLFYKTAYLMRENEVREYMNTHLTQKQVDTAIKNTRLIGDRVEDFDLSHKIMIPLTKLPKFEMKHYFFDYYDKYKYIKIFAESEKQQDRYLMYQIEKGIKEKLKVGEDCEESLNRINIELREFYEISQIADIDFSAYYNTMANIIEIIWTEGDSLVAVGRGSSGSFLLCYLLGITQINPLPLGDLMPHWRHLSKERGIDPPDIDFDSESNKRKQIIEAVKNHYGRDKVLNVGTYGTLSAKTAIQLAGKGLGYNDDDIRSISNLVPIDRGFVRDLETCINGDEEKELKPIKEMKNELDKFPDLEYVARALEQLIVNSGTHAGGLIITNEAYTSHNACMKNASGELVTQFELHDSEAMGAIKYDFLSINSLDKIRSCMDSLVEQGYMKWQGSLKETYFHYLCPETALDYEDRDMWEQIPEIQDLFQFDTNMGEQAIAQIKPHDIMDLTTGNSVMRLMADKNGVTPLELYAEYKRDVSKWYKHMDDYGLNKDEQSVLRQYLDISYGIAESQEKLMLISMDERVSNFTLTESNKLRKSVAKKSEKILSEAREQFFSKGRQQGTRDVFLKYVWEEVFAKSFSYSFSSVHSYEYSVIAIQQMNLACKYPRVFWDTACLTINSQAEESDKKSKTKDYGKVATALSKTLKQGISISLPHIDKAKFGFVPDVENNSIVFGLKAISSINDDIVHEILAKRPFSSFQDFLERTFLSADSLIKTKHVTMFIKSGALDDLGDRLDLMNHFIRILSEPKIKLNMQNFPSILEKDILPEEFNLEVRYFKYRKYILSSTPIEIIKNEKGKESDRLYLLDNISTEFYLNHFNEDDIIRYENNNIVISKKQFEKEYKKKIQNLSEFVSNDKDLLKRFNQSSFDELWNKHCKGTISTWEMESLGFYYHEHELANTDKDKYGLVNYFELSEEPTVIGYNKFRGKETPKFKIDRIAGTILDKDKNKHTVTILTTDGVVNVKFYGGAFGHYDKQESIIDEATGKKTVIEKSWFKRNNIAVFTGFRRGNYFMARKYSDSIYQHTVSLVKEIKENGDLVLINERVMSE